MGARSGLGPTRLRIQRRQLAVVALGSVSANLGRADICETPSALPQSDIPSAERNVCFVPIWTSRLFDHLISCRYSGAGKVRPRPRGLKVDD